MPTTNELMVQKMRKYLMKQAVFHLMQQKSEIRKELNKRKCNRLTGIWVRFIS